MRELTFGTGLSERLKSIPWWVYLIIAGGIAFLFLRKKPETTTTSNTYSEQYYLTLQKIEAEKQIALQEAYYDYLKVKTQYETLYDIESLKANIELEKVNAIKQQNTFNFLLGVGNLLTSWIQLYYQYNQPSPQPSPQPLPQPSPEPYDYSLPQLGGYLA